VPRADPRGCHYRRTARAPPGALVADAPKGLAGGGHRNQPSRRPIDSTRSGGCGGSMTKNFRTGLCAATLCVATLIVLWDGSQLELTLEGEGSVGDGPITSSALTGTWVKT